LGSVQRPRQRAPVAAVLATSVSNAVLLEIN
jgi:hypothetical protein